ncbi:hypothetical protein [Devosia sp. A449]
MSRIYRALKVIGATLGGFLIGAVALPFGHSELALMLGLAAGLAVFFWTRKRKSTQGATGIAEAGSPILSPAEQIRRGKFRLWGSALAFAAIIAGGIFWAYASDQNDRIARMKSNVASETQEMLGPNFQVESVSLPNGIQSHETIAGVVFTILADGQRDSLTMVLTGNCADVCRIRMDPVDALRLAPLR